MARRRRESWEEPGMPTVTESKTAQTKQIQPPVSQSGLYQRQVWSHVLLPLVIDAYTAAIVVFLMWGIAQGIVRVAAGGTGITSAHITQAAGLVGLCYTVAILITVSRRFYYSAFINVKPVPDSGASEPPAEKGKTEC